MSSPPDWKWDGRKHDPKSCTPCRHYYTEAAEHGKDRAEAAMRVATR